MSTHSRTTPTDRKGPEVSRTHRLASEVGASGVFVPPSCPGPAGTWPCALEFGHGGDHERFAPEPSIDEIGAEVLSGVKRLRAERNQLLLTCADLLEALKDLREAATPAYKAGRLEAYAFVSAGNAIAKAESK